MRDDPISYWTVGGWRTARKSFKCEYWRGKPDGRCPNVIQPGDEYYDTGDGRGDHYFATERICRECAERVRASLRKTTEVQLADACAAVLDPTPVDDETAGANFRRVRDLAAALNHG